MASLQSQAADSHALLRPPGLWGLQWRYGRCSTPKVSKQPGDQGGRCPTRRAISIAPWSLVQRCLSREQGSLSFDSQFGFRASKWLAPALQPWVWAPKLESTPPSHPASVVGSRGQGQPWGLGTSQAQLSFVVSQPAGHGYPRLRRQKGAVSCCSCSPQTLPWEE